jgi:hypothetical protein
MNHRQARELLALRRELEELRRSVELLRKTPPPTASSFARAAILQPVSEIPGRVADGDNFDISHGPAKIFDLVVRQGAGDWVMSEVKPSTGAGPRVELANPLDSALPDTDPVLGIQILGQAWVPVMGGGGGGQLFRFELTANFTTGTTVAATIKNMAGTTVGTGISLTDPEAIFLGLETGSKGYCLLQGGVYYAIQAACNDEEGYL